MSYDTSAETLRSFIASCGAIEDLRVAVDADGYAKGFAHIDFEDASSGAKAIELSG